MHITKQISSLFITLLLALFFSAGTAHSSLKIPLELSTSGYTTSSGQTIVAVTIDMADEWYTYSDTPGGMGKPTKLTGVSADGQKLTALYPAGITKPDAFDPTVMVNKYFSGTNIYILVPSDATFPLQLRIDLLLCHPTKCVPVRRDLSFGAAGIDTTSFPPAAEQPWWDTFIKLQPVAQDASGPSPTADTPEETVTAWNFTPKYLQPGLEVRSLFSAILMGLLAGLILNIMPCVLPVISLKLSAILNSTTITNEEERIHAFREHNLFFVLGVLAFFTFLAIVLGATGQAWGALFQKPWLVLAIAAIIIALSLSLFGLFHLPVVDLRFGSDSNSPRVQAFFTGNLTTLLATPCSGPFLGGVLSWALVQGPVVIATVFISIGVGMSLPYLLLIINPGLSRFLPKAGPWIEYVEKGIAFFLVATAFYLISIALGSQYLRILGPLWAALLGAWLWVRTKEGVSDTRKWIVRGVTIALFLAVIAWTTPQSADDRIWEPFNPVALTQQIESGPVFVDFTADWCPTCKALEATVLTPKNIQEWKRKYGIKFIKVDLTERDLESEALLKALGSLSIPTAAFFTPESKTEPLVLRDLFTKTQLENILSSWKK